MPGEITSKIDVVSNHVATMVVQFSKVRLPKKNRGLDQDVLDSFMKLRRHVFAEGKGWRVWLTCSSDLDQYDQLDAYYVIAYDVNTGKALAGCRLLRTDRGGAAPDCATMTYMVRDAGRGVLPGLPGDLCEQEPPCDSEIWELTRFASNGEPGPGSLVLQEVRRFLIAQGASKFIFLSPPAVSRLAKREGFFNVRPLGPMRGGLGNWYRVFAADLFEAKETEAVYG